MIGLVATAIQFIFLLKNASENLNNSIKYIREQAKHYKNELKGYTDLINKIFLLDFNEETYFYMRLYMNNEELLHYLVKKIVKQ